MAYTLKDSRTATDNDWWAVIYPSVASSGGPYLASSWLAGSSYVLGQIEILISKIAGSVNGSIGAMIYSDNGAGSPSAALGVSANAHPMADFTTNPTTAWLGWQFTGVNIVSGTRYHLVPYGIGIDASVNIHCESQTAGVTGEKITASVTGSGAWTDISAASQFMYKTYDGGVLSSPRQIWWGDDHAPQRLVRPLVHSQRIR